MIMDIEVEELAVGDAIVTHVKVRRIVEVTNDGRKYRKVYLEDGRVFNWDLHRTITVDTNVVNKVI